jgi:molecular chaperone GrpE
VTEDLKMKDDKTRDTGEVEGTSPPENQDESSVTEALDLADELVQIQAKATEYLDGWQRERAEFANYRKRVEREKEETFQRAQITVLKKLLPVIDDLERALDNTPSDIADHPWTQGVVLIGDKFHNLLHSSGLVEISTVGEAFDPNRHEAVGMDDHDEIASGHVTVVLQKGYAYGDKVLRPAMVRVAN